MTPETERLMTETDVQRSQRLPPRELLVEGTLAVLLLAGMLALAWLAPADRAFNLPLAAAFVGGYVVLHRLEFRVGAGNFTPTELLVVPMLLLLPTPLVPLLVELATMSANAAEVVRGRRARNRLMLAFNDAGFALTPALV